MIIGITGPYCSGKDEMANYLEQKNFFHISLSDILRQKIRQKRKIPTREELIKTGNELRKKEGSGILARLALHHTEANKNYTITSIRNPTEIEILKTRKDFILVKIETQQKTRYERMQKREKRDDNITKFEEFQQKEKQEESINPEEQQLHKCIQKAQITITNNKNLTEFYNKIDKFLKDWKPKLDKRPTWDEYFLELLKQVATRATCDRGRQAALIVKNKRIISTGYVGSAAGLQHCDEAGHLMRTMIADDGTQTRHCIRTLHAEQNAICQAARNGISIEGATIYCKMTPCYTCAKIIINSGIKRVVCEKRYHADQLTLETFKQAKIKLDIIEEKTEKYKDQ